MGLRVLPWLALLWVLAGTLIPQERNKTPQRSRAATLIRQLELPERRAQAADDLLALGPAAVPAIADALRDPRPEVVERLALALRLFDEAAAPAVPVLRELTASEVPGIARAAQWALAPFAPRGVCVAADCKAGAIVEYDDAGKELHRLDVEGLWGVDLLPSGRYLASVSAKGQVLELDRDGTVRWTCTAAKTPVYAVRLPSDHTLVVDSSGNRVLEVDVNGEVVWSQPATNPSSATRLPDGNTLIAEYGGKAVVLVDRTGKEVWRREEPGAPMDLRWFANGGTLMAIYETSELRERDAAGKVVLSVQLPGKTESVDRLPDGTTLASGDGWLVRVDRTGKELARHQVGRLTTIRHY